MIPSGIIIVNNDLTDNIKYNLEKQLFITDIMDGYSFDVAVQDGYFKETVLANKRRVLVIRSLIETNNREIADLVLFVSGGMVTVEKNNFGPPGKIFRIAEVYWQKLGIL
jgi:hypothetical protein